MTVLRSAAAAPRRAPVPRLRAGLTAAGALLMAGAGLVACSSGPTAQNVAQSYLSDWARRDWPAMRALVDSPPGDFTAVNAAALTDLGAKQASFRPGRLAVSGSTAREPVTERIPVPGVGTIAIATSLRLTSSPGRWLVRWSPATIAPQLTRPGDRLSLEVTWAPRAQITGAGGAPLTTQAAMVMVGVEGQRIKKEAVVRSALLTAGATKQAIDAALTGARAQPAWFQPVMTVSWQRYQQLQPKIYPIPGTVFQTIHERAPVSPGLAYIVGSVGPVTAQQLSALGAPYTAQSIVGQTGLEFTDQKQLAGRPARPSPLSPRPGRPPAPWRPCRRSRARRYRPASTRWCSRTRRTLWPGCARTPP